jgi:type IV pilus assembly protein PilW
MPASLKPTSHQGKSRQRGLSLIELTVSLALGIILMLAATQGFMFTKMSTRAQEATSRLMENGRAATELLHRSVRMARYFGCAGVEATSVTNHYDISTPAQTPTTLNGYDQQGIFGVNGTTDEITVYIAQDDTNAPLTADIDLAALNNPLKLNSGHGLDPNDMVAVTDCTQADVFNITAVNTGVAPNELSYANCATCSHSYLANASVLKVARYRYYIDIGANGEPALFLEDPQDGSDTPLELIEGVEDMQILYGLDTDANGVANQYVSPATILAVCNTEGNNNCWRRVSSVRVALLLKSEAENVVTKPQTYRFNGASITAIDRRIRREFLTIVALRNYRP